MKRYKTYCLADDAAAFAWASEQPVSFTQQGYYFFTGVNGFSKVRLKFYDFATDSNTLIDKFEPPLQVCSLSDDLIDTSVISTGLILLFVVAFAFKAKIKALG